MSANFISTMNEIEIREKYFQNSFIKERILGYGVSGQVFRVRNKNDLTQISAIKQMYENHGTIEVTMLKLLHDNPLALKYIIEYFDSWIDRGRSLCIQMECCEMDLKCLMSRCCQTFRSTPTSKMDCIEFFISCIIYRKILNCINYIHTHLPPVIHCDLHMKNILVKVVNDKVELKLADFAFSIVQDQPEQRQVDLIQLGKLLRQLFKYDALIGSEQFQDRYKKVDQISRVLMNKKEIGHDNLVEDLSQWQLTVEQLRTEFNVDMQSIERYNNSSDRLFYNLLKQYII